MCCQLVFFCLAAAQSATIVIAGLVEVFVPPRMRQISLTLPLIGPVPVIAVIVFPVAASVSVFWAVMRHEDWAWGLQVGGDDWTLIG